MGTLKFKLLKHKKMDDTFGSFFEIEGNGELGLSATPQLFPETCTIDGLKRFSTEQIIEQLDSGEWELITVSLCEGFGEEAQIDIRDLGG